MDVQLQNLQFLGIYGILKETMKLIYQWRRIFSHIALPFILPLPLIYLANFQIFSFFFQKQPLDVVFPKTIIYYVLFSIASFIFSTAFSLLSTAAVASTIACIYAARDVSFRHVISILPSVCKRLLLTFLCVFTTLFAFNVAASFTLSVILLVVFFINGPPNNELGFVSIGGFPIIIFVFMVFFCVGSWYLVIIWQLSSYVSVVEDCCGFKAMAKSKALVKGKMWMVMMSLVMLNFPLGLFKLLFYYLFFQSTAAEVAAARGLWVIIWVLCFSLFFLFKLVGETVLYFVCKSCHHESVDMSSSADLSDYVPLKDDDDDAQVEKLQVV